ncbi:potassium channel family protein [Georgenia sp. 10Sc9-8]|uniref:Potassium channel family protein n=1 Tax=Georgenia halotolerans TaxID=3028317 RepID=A0ABT5U038_9MICO|nr:potassium channel family protein [Georgenia halotolerans]
MSWLWSTAGVLLALLTVDVVLTTLGAGVRSGPVTGRLTRGLWRLLLVPWRRRGSTAAIQHAGPVLLIVVVLTWVVLLWLAWTLVFLAGDPAVQDATTGTGADTAEVVYFVGFTVFTLGVGDYAATTDLWRILTAVASFSGLFLVTLSITYLLNVVPAVVQRRALAQQIHAMGTDAVALLRSGWDGQSFTGTFLEQLNNLTAPLSQVGEQQLAYPVLAYFRGSREHAALPVAAATLDDAMLLLDEAVLPEARPGDVPQSLRTLLAQLLNTSAMVRTGSEETTPPEPDLPALRASGIPLREAGEVGRVVRDDPQRRELAAFVHGSGWPWPHGQAPAG